MKPFLVIVGLGNPGKQYEETRHNAGFRAVELLAKEFGTDEWRPMQKFRCDLKEGCIVTFPILLIKPTTYMNDSGSSVRLLIDFYKIDPKTQLLVIADDIDLPVGEIRMRDKGGHGTHNGLQSVINQFGESFRRIRIGIRGPDAPDGSFQAAGKDLSAYVLSKPPEEERVIVEKVMEGIPEMVKGLVTG